jgi:hypothetical protein
MPDLAKLDAERAWKGVDPEVAEWCGCNCADEHGRLGWGSKHSNTCPEYHIETDELKELLRRAMAHAFMAGASFEDHSIDRTLPNGECYPDLADYVAAIKNGDVEP